MKSLSLRVLTLLVIFCASSYAQFGAPEEVTVEAFLSVDKIRPGDEFKIGIKAIIDPEWHINSHKPKDEFLIPTVVDVRGPEGLNFEGMHYPEGEMKRFSFSPEPVSVYEGSVLVWSKVRAKEGLELGQTTITGTFGYQACNDALCLAPAKIPFEIKAQVVNSQTPVALINEGEFERSDFELAELKGERTETENEISTLLEGSGFAITLVFVFLGGLALNLTPCVYPLIPITISYFGGQASDNLGKSFFLALIYVLGMAITYSVLGVGAALSGGLLGSSLQSPIVLLAISTVFLVFAASMFGAFEIRVPTALSNLAGGSRKGVFGSLVMGLTVGIVAAPCVGPFVLSLLTYVAAKSDPLLGFLMFFVLSLGLGLPFLVLGTFSGLIKNLPRSGEWMIWVKKVFGVIMIGVAIYFISTLIPEVAYVVGLTAVAVLGGIFLGFLDNTTAGINWFKGLKTAIGTIMILFGVWTSVSAWQDGNKPRINWQPYSENLVAQAKAGGKPVLIDFFADWCIPCRQIDRTLFAEPSIVAKSEAFFALKADLTKEGSEDVKAMRQKYRVVGVPTVILIDREGKEFRRFTDELVKFEVAKFLAVMDGVM